MNRQKLQQARQMFSQAAEYGGDNHSVNLMAKGLTQLADALLETSRTVQDSEITDELEQD